MTNAACHLIEFITYYFDYSFLKHFPKFSVEVFKTISVEVYNISDLYMIKN